MSRRLAALVFVAVVGCLATEPPVDAVALQCAPPQKKLCGGQCVDVTDPAFGCASNDCAPCAVPHAALAVCRPDGRCGAAKCSGRWGDCDGDSANGCESDFVSASNCGGCGRACPADQLCSSKGCGPPCDPKCGLICPDYDSDELNCKSCGNVCPTDPHGVAACVNAKCVVNCNDGWSHCNGTTGPCAPRYFVDQDKDGFGTGVGAVACSQPPGTSTLGGDCNDQDPNVFPGQKAYFATGYPVQGGVSFDYDCNGIETPASPAFMLGVCSTGTCVPGYAPSPRSGPGVNRGCGSSQGWQCQGPCALTSRPPFACH